MKAKLNSQGGGIKAEKLTLATNIDGIFAGGDIAYGPKSVVEAISQGHEAAESIRRFIEGKDIAAGRKKEEKPLSKVPKDRPYYKKARSKAETIPVKEREGNYKEIAATFTQEMAIEEAKRCLLMRYMQRVYAMRCSVPARRS